LSWDELSEKYRALAGTVWSQQKVETVRDAVRRLEQENDMRNFAALL
jgi:hypothetical protein